VKYDVTTCHCLLQGGRITQVSGYPVRLQFLNIPEVAVAAHQQPQIGALFGQNAGYVAAYESSGAGDES
jgi:hypothetical protein